MIPAFTDAGLLPPGCHAATWMEFGSRFGWNAKRVALLSGLRAALDNLRSAGCSQVFIDGSFVTSKEFPSDFDGCWDTTGVSLTVVDPVLLDLRPGRIAQKVKYGGELFPADLQEGLSGRTFLEFFQVNKEDGVSKGIVSVNLGSLS